MICCRTFSFRVGAFRSGKTSRKEPRRDRGLGMTKGGSGMEGSSGRRMASGRLDVAEDVFKKVGCDGGSKLDSGSYGFLGGNSW